jgi:hypothetical protein
MSENDLTCSLVQSLKNGEMVKIVRHSGKKVLVQREVGDGSFRADIFISLENSNSHSFNKFNFIAIEVKIKDWQQGLYQAYRYKSFAEKSYLAIYEKYSKGIDINLFKKYNVGLISFNERGIKILNKPKTNKFVKKSHSSELRKSLMSKMSFAVGL